MASLEQRNGSYRIVFRLAGEKFSRSLKTSKLSVAEAALVRLNDNLHRPVLGLIELPEHGDVVDLLLGRSKQVNKSKKSAPQTRVSIRKAWEVFKESIPQDALEQSTLKGMKTHVDHLARIIGPRVTLREVDKPVLQCYIELRSKEQGRYGRNVSGT